MTSTISDFTKSGNLFYGGAFLGNRLITDKDLPYKVIAYQEVNPIFLSNMDEVSGHLGKNMFHEITEAYEGAKISLKKRQEAIPNSDIYKKAHKLATPQDKLYRTLYDKDGFITKDIDKTIYFKIYMVNKQGKEIVLMEMGK